MKKITDLVGHDLTWLQPHALQMDYELRDGETPVATLRFRSRTGSLATGESADGCWTFKRAGFFQTRVTVRENGCETNLAIFRNRTWNNGGTLELGDGRKYLVDINFWATQYSFKTETGEEIIRYQKVDGVLHLSSKVEITTAAQGVAEIPWMLLLGWYMAVMINVDMLPIHQPVGQPARRDDESQIE